MRSLANGWRFWACVALSAVCGGHASAAMLSIDPDDYGAGTDLTQVAPGVTIHAYRGAAISGEAVRAVEPDLQWGQMSPSTGQFVFGFGDDQPSIFSDATRKGLLVQFDAPASYVAIDYLANQDGDAGQMLVIDRQGKLMATVQSDELPEGGYATLAYEASGPRISQIVVASLKPYRTGGLDRLVIDAPGLSPLSPEPASLMLLALACPMLTGRRKG